MLNYIFTFINVGNIFYLDLFNTTPIISNNATLPIIIPTIAPVDNPFFGEGEGVGVGVGEGAGVDSNLLQKAFDGGLLYCAKQYVPGGLVPSCGEFVEGFSVVQNISFAI